MKDEKKKFEHYILVSNQVRLQSLKYNKQYNITKFDSVTNINRVKKEKRIK